VFGKHKALRWFQEGINSGITLYIVTGITVYPLMALYFGSFPIVGLAANMVLLPLLIIAFKFSVIALVTYVGFPLLYVADWLTQAVINASNWLASLSFAQVSLNLSGYWYIFYFIGLFMISRFVFMRKMHKYAVAGVCFGIYAISVLLMNI